MIRYNLYSLVSLKLFSHRLLSYLLVLNLHQNKPNKVPAPIAVRIRLNSPFCIVYASAGERVVGRELPEFVEKVIGCDVVFPGGSHCGAEGALLFFWV